MRDKFLKLTQVTKESEAMSSSIMAALQHNPTYSANVSMKEKEKFRETLSNEIKKHAINYYKPIPEDIHNQNIIEICKDVSLKHSAILIDSKLRIGTTQKAFNLYLKFLWCLDPNRADPPHCPIDRVVLNHAGIGGAWTKLDSLELYMQWIARLKETATKAGFSSIQQWELSIWNGIP